ncbi:YfbM family protein [Hymenobacter sp. YC55]|uniref:YfbM family protein n=1 Tax=Hymenobacter sp. YC55 TaxID=3034019 RepID=UPI0023F6D55B|nr:YfbM family protein [Hymenobacter sp. YC55]MDF7813244.1 YfbM family protein [Hymenobacter sp. YC55]
MCSVLRQIDEKQAKSLLKNPDDVFDFVDEEVLTDEELDLDKTWHGIHFLLTNTVWEGEEPLCFLVRGGQEVGNEDHDVGYGPARILRQPEVAAFAHALAAIEVAEFKNRYNAENLSKQEIYPEVWNDEDSAENRSWLADGFEQLREFISRSANSNKALLIWLQ